MNISSNFLINCYPEFLGNLIVDKVNSVAFDNSKIKRLVPDYNIAKRFDEGVKMRIDYALSHHETQVPDE